jgi:hypothetical protein
MTSPIAIVAYLLAFLILIVYTADAFVQWRYLRGKSKKYLAIQLVVIISVGAADVTLVVLHERGAKEAVLHGLQGLSFLQSLVITVCTSLPYKFLVLLTIDIGHASCEGTHRKRTSPRLEGPLPMGLLRLGTFRMGLLPCQPSCVELFLYGHWFYPEWR